MRRQRGVGTRPNGHRVEKVSVPLSYTEELYALRGHIDMVRKKLQGGAPNAEDFSA